MFNRKKQIGEILMRLEAMKSSINGIDERLLKLSEQFDNYVSPNHKHEVSDHLEKTVYPPAQPGGEAAGKQSLD